MLAIGRRRVLGERYPCGKLKRDTNQQSISPTAWRRIKDEGVRYAVDPRLGTELGKLALHGELTAAQVAAGFRFAEIYGRYERYKRLKRATASPSYMQTYGDPDVAEDRLSDDELRDHEHRIRSAERAFNRLNEALPPHPATARDVLEQLCVDDRPINSLLLDDVRFILQRLALYFRTIDRGQRPAPVPKKATRTAEQPQTAPSPSHAARDREAFAKVVGTIRPDLMPADLVRAWKTMHALKDRIEFRKSRPR